MFKIVEDLIFEVRRVSHFDPILPAGCGAGGLFCVRWNNHHRSLSNAIEEDREVPQSNTLSNRSLKTLVEQYVEVRKRRYDFVSTDLASRALRQLILGPISDHALDEMIASCAVERGIAVRFDRSAA
jgi:hypothetical protein